MTLECTSIALSDFLSVSIGETVTLKCSHKGQTLKRIFWFKKSFGRKPELICSFYVHSTEVEFFDEFKNNRRFILDTENKNHNLKIFDFQFSDSATYNCIHSDSYILTFLESYSVHVKDPSSSIQTSLDQSSSENIHPGDSVTLNCTVHTGSCDGEHRVYWFKDSEDSHPGLIYTDGGRNDQCERKKNTQTHSCVYKLHMKNLIESHSGIYYCAVVSCGHILFGNGTKLDLTEENFPPFVYFLSGVLTAALIFLTSYTIHKTQRCKSKGKILFSDFFINDIHFLTVKHSIKCFNLLSARLPLLKM
uniref:Ig-like domain-containing protein n=1 Tax=Oryzias melastigma TaxID=30732 RepID=A0A3B3CI25_ORYME